LKLLRGANDRAQAWVRPRAGAWIETLSKGRVLCSRVFAPARGRGLKRKLPAGFIPLLRFAPARGRGLKLRKVRSR